MDIMSLLNSVPIQSCLNMSPSCSLNRGSREASCPRCDSERKTVQSCCVRSVHSIHWATPSHGKHFMHKQVTLCAYHPTPGNSKHIGPNRSSCARIGSP